MLKRTALAAVTVTTATMCAVTAAASASAAPRTVHVTSGTTEVTVAPAVTTALLSRGIVPWVTRPGRPGLGSVDQRPTLTATYPVTGGRLTAQPLGGTVEHRGGLKFVNVLNGRALEVGNFTVDLDKGRLTGRLAGTTTRVPVFTLDTSTARITLGKHTLDARKVTLKLTGTAANALNTTLHTQVFTDGLTVGTADTRARF